MVQTIWERHRDILLPMTQTGVKIFQNLSAMRVNQGLIKAEKEGHVRESRG